MCWATQQRHIVSHHPMHELKLHGATSHKCFPTWHQFGTNLAAAACFMCCMLCCCTQGSLHHLTPMSPPSGNHATFVLDPRCIYAASMFHPCCTRTCCTHAAPPVACMLLPNMLTGFSALFLQLQAGSQPQQQQLLPEDPVGRPAPTPELHPHLPAKHSHPDADQGDGRPSSTAALHPHLPANHSNPDADQGGPASSASPATSLLPSWDRSSGVGSADGNAAKGSSQNAFVLLMKASKASAKGKLMGTPGGQLKAGGLSHSQGRPAGNLAGAAAFGRSQGGWQDTLQRIAAEPERCLEYL